MDDRLLDILCCPATRAPLRRTTEAEIASVNRAAASGELRTRGGAPVAADGIRAGLVTRDGQLLYRVDDGIPVLLADEAIATGQVADFPRR